MKPDPPSEPAGRLRRFQLFAGAEAAALNDSCGKLTADPYPPLEPEAPDTALGRLYNARAAVSGGVRILLHDSGYAYNSVLRIAVTSRRLFGAGDQPGRTANGISVGFTLFWFPLRE